MTKLNGFKLAASALALSIAAGAASAQTTQLRMQTHFSQEQLSGQMAQEFIDNVHAMSNGDIAIEMIYSSALVASAETFDAAATGILDCDMTGGAYQTGINPAFQFAGDLTGAYENPYQQMAWLLHAGGHEALNDLYNEFGMTFIGWWIPGPESLSSTSPIRNVADFEGWQFRSPPGVITMIFENLGATPIVMDFTEIFTALETGIIDGADAANITNNIGLGLYDIAEHTNYPGFHSMPADHLACRTDVWESMPDHHRAIITTAMEALALRNATINEIENARNAEVLREQGINLYAWSEEDMSVYRAAVQEAWVDFATTPEAEALLDSHLSFLREIGAME